MGFKEVIDLDCEVAIALGGSDRKTGKANHTQVEGYFIGSKDVPSKKSKTGTAKLHIFQTQKGNLGVWGKTDLDRKLLGVAPGTMTRVTFTGMQETNTNPMYKYRVEADASNTIDVGQLTQANAESAEAPDYSNPGDDLSDGLDDDQPLDIPPPPPARKPAQAATTPDAARQAKVRALLEGNRSKG